jgi:hypothetical protein
MRRQLMNQMFDDSSGITRGQDVWNAIAATNTIILGRSTQSVYVPATAQTFRSPSCKDVTAFDIKLSITFFFRSEHCICARNGSLRNCNLPTVRWPIEQKTWNNVSWRNTRCLGVYGSMLRTWCQTSEEHSSLHQILGMD